MSGDEGRRRVRARGTAMDGRSKRPLWAALGVVVVAAVGGTVLATRDRDEPDPDALLGRASELVEDAEGFRVEATAEERSTVGEAGGAGTETTYRTVTTGVVSGAGWRETGGPRGRGGEGRARRGTPPHP